MLHHSTLCRLCLLSCATFRGGYRLSSWIRIHIIIIIIIIGLPRGPLISSATIWRGFRTSSLWLIMEKLERDFWLEHSKNTVLRIKVKVQLSLCLTKHHTMKTVLGEWRYTMEYPKLPGQSSWNENSEWYSSLPLGAVLSLSCESV
jgi:hypothetical protein